MSDPEIIFKKNFPMSLRGFRNSPSKDLGRVKKGQNLIGVTTGQ